MCETRLWRCPICDETVDWSYDDLADKGSPVCECDSVMELED